MNIKKRRIKMEIIVYMNQEVYQSVYLYPSKGVWCLSWYNAKKKWVKRYHQKRSYLAKVGSLICTKHKKTLCF